MLAYRIQNYSSNTSYAFKINHNNYDNHNADSSIYSNVCRRRMHHSMSNESCNSTFGSSIRRNNYNFGSNMDMKMLYSSMLVELRRAELWH